MEIQNKKTNICVIGAGYWGNNHIKTLLNMGISVNIVDPNEKSLKKNKKKYPVTTFSDLDSAINFGHDGYVVATPSSTHFEIAYKIINSKNHVLVEKPFTSNKKEAKILNDLAQKNNVYILVGHILLFHPAVKKIKEYIETGKIGKLQYIYSNRLNLGKVRTDENVFWSFAPHDISVLQYLIKEYPDNINISGSAFLQKDIYDTTLTILKYPNNITAHIYLSWLHPFKEHRLVVIGSKGMISFDDSSENKELKYYDKNYTLLNKKPKKRDGSVISIEFKDIQPLQLELEYFINCIKHKNKPEISNGNNGYEVISILEETANLLNKSKKSN